MNQYAREALKELFGSADIKALSCAYCPDSRLVMDDNTRSYQIREWYHDHKKCEHKDPPKGWVD